MSMQDEKIIETSLEKLIGRVFDIKTSLQNFLLKIEHEQLTWPQVLDNFAILSGQINTLNKLLKNDRMPVLKDLCVLPILVNPDHDEELATATENRIPVFNHEVVPDALRTKPEPVVEKAEQELSAKAAEIVGEEADRQVASLNTLVTSLLDLIQSKRDEWQGDVGVQQADLNPSSKDTNILIAAMSTGTGLRKREPSNNSKQSSSSRSQMRTNRSNTPR